MLPRLVINFTDPSPLPDGGFLVAYRPKGSVSPYFTFVQPTGSPVVLTANLIGNVDYEGTISSSCATLPGGQRNFSTNNFNNATGNIITGACATAGAITIVQFNNRELLPLGRSLPMGYHNSGAFVSNLQGVGTLLINHTLTVGTISFTDSLNVTTTQEVGAGSNTFSGTINSTNTFGISVSGC